MGLDLVAGPFLPKAARNQLCPGFILGVTAPTAFSDVTLRSQGWVSAIALPTRAAPNVPPVRNPPRPGVLIPVPDMMNGNLTSALPEGSICCSSRWIRLKYAI